MGDGHFSPSGIDGSYACLYYSLPIQHISVSRVLHTQDQHRKTHVIHTRDTLPNVGKVT